MNASLLIYNSYLRSLEVVEKFLDSLYPTEHRMSTTISSSETPIITDWENALVVTQLHKDNQLLREEVNLLKEHNIEKDRYLSC